MSNEILEGILISKNVNPTAMRLLTLDFLTKQKSAVSITDIEKGFNSCDRITLYRTLKTFEKKGLIHSIEDSKVIKYALCNEDCSENMHVDTHLHFYCTKCQKTMCLPKVKIPEVNMPADFKIRELSLVAKGECAACA